MKLENIISKGRKGILVGSIMGLTTLNSGCSTMNGLVTPKYNAENNSVGIQYSSSPKTKGLTTTEKVLIGVGVTAGTYGLYQLVHHHSHNNNTTTNTNTNSGNNTGNTSSGSSGNNTQPITCPAGTTPVGNTGNCA